MSEIRARVCWFFCLSLSLFLPLALALIAEFPPSFSIDIVSTRTWVPKRKTSFKIKLIWIEIFHGPEKKQPPGTVIEHYIHVCRIERESLCYDIHCSWHLKIAFLHSSSTRINWNSSVCVSEYVVMANVSPLFTHPCLAHISCFAQTSTHTHTRARSVHYKHPMWKLITLFNAKNSVAANRLLSTRLVSLLLYFSTEPFFRLAELVSNSTWMRQPYKRI